MQKHLAYVRWQVEVRSIVLVGPVREEIRCGGGHYQSGFLDEARGLTSGDPIRLPRRGSAPYHAGRLVERPLRIGPRQNHRAREWTEPARPCTGNLQRAKEVEEILLLLWGELFVEQVDDCIRFRPASGVLLNRMQQAAVRRRGPSVVQEENALAYAPERRSSKFIAAGAPLRNAIRQSRTHVVHQQVRK